MARLGRGQPNRPTIVRNTLVDPPVLTTPAPVVTSRQPERVRLRVNQGQVLRSTLADAPILATPAPVVVFRQPEQMRLRANQGAVSRSSLEDVSLPVATPSAVVVVEPIPGRWLAVNKTIIVSGLPDTTVEVPAATPAAIVVFTQPRNFGKLNTVIITDASSGFATEPIPAALVITPKPRVPTVNRPIVWTPVVSSGPITWPVVVTGTGIRRGLLSPTILLRAPLVDIPPVVYQSTPMPVVVSTPTQPRTGRLIINHAPEELSPPPPPPVIIRDIGACLGTPGVAWSIGEPEVAWASGEPQLAWSIEEPEMAWSSGEPRSAWTLGSVEVDC